MSISYGVVVRANNEVLAQWSLPKGRKLLKQGVIDLSLQHKDTLLVAHWDEEGGPSFREAYYNGELRQDMLPPTLADYFSKMQCCGDIGVEEDFLSFAWNCEFDVDKVFDILDRDKEHSCVNFYTDWFPDGRFRAFYVINLPHDNSSEVEIPLSEDEEWLLIEKTNDYCKEKEDSSLFQMWVNTHPYTVKL